MLRRKQSDHIISCNCSQSSSTTTPLPHKHKPACPHFKLPETILLPNQSVVLGRAQSSASNPSSQTPIHIHIDSVKFKNLISRQHALITYTASTQQRQIIDNESVNGLFVNRRRVKQQILKNGDEITLGGANQVKMNEKVDFNHAIQSDVIYEYVSKQENGAVPSTTLSTAAPKPTVITNNQPADSAEFSMFDPLFAPATTSTSSHKRRYNEVTSTPPARISAAIAPTFSTPQPQPQPLSSPTRLRMSLADQLNSLSQPFSIPPDHRSKYEPNEENQALQPIPETSNQVQREEEKQETVVDNNNESRPEAQKPELHEIPVDANQRTVPNDEQKQETVDEVATTRQQEEKQQELQQPKTKKVKEEIDLTQSEDEESKDKSSSVNRTNSDSNRKALADELGSEFTCSIW